MAPPSKMATLDSDLFKCCHSLTVLRWPQDMEALSLLERATTQVRPLMAKRKWTVPLVAEFYPSSPQLLGLNHNHGSKIEVRLRTPQNPEVFLPYESILGTLLHELVHIEIGPHNAAFYALLDELRGECDELIWSGNDGTRAEGVFTGRGRRVGQGVTMSVPRGRAGEVAAAAARQRERARRMMPAGGRRLGGSAGIARLCDPREMALAAAQRRANDEVWCGGEVETEVVDLDGGDGEEGEEDEVEVVQVRRVTGKAKAKAKAPRLQAGKVPVRQNAAARAAMERLARKR